jgi:hypothetical protein
MNELPFKNSNCFQTSTEDGESDWVLRENKTNKQLFVLPKCIKDSDIFRILDFVKAIEADSYKAGVNFYKSKCNSYYGKMLAEKESIIQLLKEENSKLATALNKAQLKGN